MINESLIAPIPTPEETQTVQTSIGEYAMISRAEYDLWKGAYDILNKLGEIGLVTEEMIKKAVAG